MLNHHLSQKFKLIGRGKFNQLINTLTVLAPKHLVLAHSSYVLSLVYFLCIWGRFVLFIYILITYKKKVLMMDLLVFYKIGFLRGNSG
jgi:hypothetical protein